MTWEFDHAKVQPAPSAQLSARVGNVYRSRCQGIAVIPQEQRVEVCEDVATDRRPEGLAEVAARLLEQHHAGLTVEDLCAALRAERLDFARVTPDQVERHLRRHTELAFRSEDRQWTTRRLAARLHEAAALDDSPVNLVPLPGDGFSGGDAHEHWVVFDVEATSTDVQTAELLQMAAVRLNADLQEIGRFEPRFVRSAGPVPEDVTHLTGIRWDDVAEADPPDVVLSDFIAFAEGARLVAHNGTAYDGPLVARIVSTCGITDATYVSLTANLVDSLIPASILLPGLVTRSISALSDALGVDLAEAHRAGQDVDALVAILRRLRGRAAALPGELRLLLTSLLGGMEEDGATVAAGVAALLALPPASQADARRELLAIVPRVPAPVRQLSATQPHAAARRAIRAAFASDGPLARTAADGKPYETRSSQVDYALHAWDALEDGQIALVEAGTGTGKTRGYLVPAIHWAVGGGGTVAVSTHTRSLQSQLLRELRSLERLPSLAPGGRAWRFAVLKGRRNYLCLHRLSEELSEVGPATPLFRRVALAMLAVWSREADQGDADEFALGWLGHQDTSGAARASRAGALCDPECVEHRCPFYGPCYYFRAVRAAETADILAVNHALLLSSPRWRDHARHLILDEAHTLEDAATDALTFEVNGADIADVLAYVHRREGDGSTGLRVRLARAVGLSRREGAASDLALAVGDATGILGSASMSLHQFLHEHDHKRDDEARYDHSFPYASIAESRPWIRATQPVRALIPALREVERAIGALLVEVQARPVVDEHVSLSALVPETQAVRQRLLDLGSWLGALLDLADRQNRVFLLTSPVTPAGVTPEERLAGWSRPNWSLRAIPV